MGLPAAMETRDVGAGIEFRAAASPMQKRNARRSGNSAAREGFLFYLRRHTFSVFFPFFFFFICLAAPERRKLRHQRHLATGAVSRPVPQHHLPDWRVSTQCVSLNQVRFSFFNKFSNDLSKYLFKFQFFKFIHLTFSLKYVHSTLNQIDLNIQMIFK